MLCLTQRQTNLLIGYFGKQRAIQMSTGGRLIPRRRLRRPPETVNCLSVQKGDVDSISLNAPEPRDC